MYVRARNTPMIAHMNPTFSHNAVQDIFDQRKESTQRISINPQKIVRLYASKTCSPVW